MNSRELDLLLSGVPEEIAKSEWGKVAVGYLQSYYALLAAVDESSDGLVRELRGIYKWSNPLYGDPMKKAAARIVALEAELASVKAERDRLNSAVRWALGYNEGEPQFQPRAEGDPPYWWRNELMRRAAHPKEGT